MGVFRADCRGDRSFEGPSACGSSPDPGRHILNRADRRAMARLVLGVGQVELRLSTIPPLERVRALGRHARCAGGLRGRAQTGADDRQHRNPGAPSSRRRKRRTEEQALGRSRGGFTTKIHARANAEGLPIAFQITAGQANVVTAYDALMDEGERPKRSSPTEPMTATLSSRIPGFTEPSPSSRPKRTASSNALSTRRSMPCATGSSASSTN